MLDWPEFVESSGTSLRRQSTVRVSSNQESANVLEAMVLNKRTLNLLALLESHAGDATLEVAVNPHPPTIAQSWASLVESLEKKRERD